MELSHERAASALQPRLPKTRAATVSLSPMTTHAIEPDVTIFVCVTCRRADEEGERPGAALFAAVQARLASAKPANVALRSVECLSVCKRPCTVALAGPGKWTYVVGDLDMAANVDDILDAALKFAATRDGLIPWRERPKSFRQGVISRVPPLLAKGA
jgi:predicted metal-binding protein